MYKRQGYYGDRQFDGWYPKLFWTLGWQPGETEPGGGLLPAPGVLVQVCDLDTGAPISQGEGQVVVTLLRPDYPLVRFGTGEEG